jgi:catechol 2,3-dioxygenase-like lactoylglutathione lyase family enzyme
MSKILDHVDLRVRNRKTATAFYDAFLAELGAVKREGVEYTTWRVPDDPTLDASDNFGIVEDAQQVAGSVRIAFKAPSRDAVDVVAKVLSSIGARNVEMDDGIYGDDYYGVFFEDPDGNRLEVCVNPVAPDEDGVVT